MHGETVKRNVVDCLYNIIKITCVDSSYETTLQSILILSACVNITF